VRRAVVPADDRPRVPCDDLDRVLDENMKWFVTDRFRNPINDVKRELKLSHVSTGTRMIWRQGCDRQVRRKIWGQDYNGYTISFVEYSWMLNEPAPK